MAVCHGWRVGNPRYSRLEVCATSFGGRPGGGPGCAAARPYQETRCGSPPGRAAPWARAARRRPLRQPRRLPLPPERQASGLSSADYQSATPPIACRRCAVAPVTNLPERRLPAGERGRCAAVGGLETRDTADWKSALPHLAGAPPGDGPGCAAARPYRVGCRCGGAVDPAGETTPSTAAETAAATALGLWMDLVWPGRWARGTLTA